VHRPAGSDIEREATALGIPNQEALAFERAADALRETLNARLELRLARALDAP
jgi:hypothetical protein